MSISPQLHAWTMGSVWNIVVEWCWMRGPSHCPCSLLMILLWGSLLEFLRRWKSATEHGQACEATASPSAPREGGGGDISRGWPSSSRDIGHWLLAFVTLGGTAEGMEGQGWSLLKNGQHTLLLTSVRPVHSRLFHGWDDVFRKSLC